MSVTPVLANISYVAQALSAPLLVATLFYAGRQLRELRRQVAEEGRSRRLAATSELIDIVGAEDVRAARRWLLNQKQGSLSPGGASADDLAKISRLRVAYDRVALMVAHGLFDHDLVLDWQGHELVRVWYLVEPFVKLERKTPGRAQHCIYFERLAEDFREKLGAAALDYLRVDTSAPD